MNILPEICQRLTAIRLRHFGPRGRRRFAQLLHIPHTTYCAYEAGRIPPADVLAAVAEVTGCDAAWLLTGQGETTSAQPANIPGLTSAQNDILRRLAQRLAGHPAALPAIEALADLLTQHPGSQETMSGDSGEASAFAHICAPPTSYIIPIIGRAAAGHILKWSSDDYQKSVHSLQTIAQAMKASATSLSVEGSGVAGETSGSAAVIRLPDPQIVGDVSIDTILEVTSTASWQHPVAVYVDGDSMANRLQHGDIVVVDTEVHPASGEIAVVMLSGQAGATCKIYWQEGDAIRLIPANPAYSPAQACIDEIVFAWKVVAIIRCDR